MFYVFTVVDSVTMDGPQRVADDHMDSSLGISSTDESSRALSSANQSSIATSSVSFSSAEANSQHKDSSLADFLLVIIISMSDRNLDDGSLF